MPPSCTQGFALNRHLKLCGDFLGGKCVVLMQVLGIGDTADASEVKRAYRRLALKTHPDVSDAPDAMERFREVVKAYEVLSDDKRRKEYDRKRRFTSAFRGGSRQGQGAGSGRGGSNRTYDPAREERARRWREENTPEQIDDSFGDILKDLVGGLRSSGGGRSVLEDVVDFLEIKVGKRKKGKKREKKKKTKRRKKSKKGKRRKKRKKGKRVNKGKEEKKEKKKKKDNLQKKKKGGPNR
ncbi:unnamed protein product [Discosporangium mesarthrocarpum]